MAKTLEVVEPATEALLAEIAIKTPEEAAAATRRAARAQELWAGWNPGWRVEMLRAIAAAIDAEHSALATLEARSTGTPISEARIEVRAAAEAFRAASPPAGEALPLSVGVRMTFRAPLGVVGMLGTRSLVGVCRRVAPALAAGNAVILCPDAPLAALELERIARAANVPEGLIAVLAGAQPALAHLVREPAPAPYTTIVCANADHALAALGLRFPHTGTHLYVQRYALKEVKARLEQSIGAKRLGDPLHVNTALGPLASAQELERVRTLVDGATVLCQGEAPAGPGFWFPPTVIEAAEEVRGPIVSLHPFDVEADLRVSGDAGSIWTRDGAQALRLAHALPLRTIAINEHGAAVPAETADAYTAPKTVFFSSLEEQDSTY